MLPTPVPGQVWQVVDRRVDRKVKIFRIQDDHALMITLGGTGRITRAKLSRFNGKIGGYRLLVGFTE